MQSSTPKLTDADAARIIERMESPLREAVASIVWWDNSRCVKADDEPLSMPLTYALMNPWDYPREYPSESDLVSGLIIAGYSPASARKRVINEDRVLADSARHKKRMCEIRKRNKERKANEQQIRSTV